jgi:hypothetical protein
MKLLPFLWINPPRQALMALHRTLYNMATHKRREETIDMLTGLLTGPALPKRFAAAILAVLAGTGAAAAEQACFPHCDYVHYYGPYDFTWAQPGLFAWPQCGAQGDCAPHLTYTTGTLRRIQHTGRITVRFPRITPAPQ